jgi:hypothetical protein
MTWTFTMTNMVQLPLKAEPLPSLKTRRVAKPGYSR